MPQQKWNLSTECRIDISQSEVRFSGVTLFLPQTNTMGVGLLSHGIDFSGNSVLYYSDPRDIQAKQYRVMATQAGGFLRIEFSVANDRKVRMILQEFNNSSEDFVAVGIFQWE